MKPYRDMVILQLCEEIIETCKKHNPASVSGIEKKATRIRNIVLDADTKTREVSKEIDSLTVFLVNKLQNLKLDIEDILEEGEE